MTHAKVAITIPEHELAAAKLAVRRGRATSLSAYVADAVAAYRREDSLRSLVDDMIAQHGKPSREDYAWADRVVTAARRR